MTKTIFNIVKIQWSTHKYHKVPWPINLSPTLLFSAEKIPTLNLIQPKQESKPLQSENKNKDTSTVTVEHKSMEHDQPVKCEGKTKKN